VRARPSIHRCCAVVDDAAGPVLSGVAGAFHRLGHVARLAEVSGIAF